MIPRVVFTNNATSKPIATKAKPPPITVIASLVVSCWVPDRTAPQTWPG